MAKKLAVAHGDKRETVVAAILERIVSGQLRGGDRLVTQDVAEMLGVSLTPVREALAELAGIGVVDLAANRGATIHAFSPSEIRQVCRVRRALECEAVRGAIGRIPPGQLRELDAELLQLAKAPIKNVRQIRRAQALDTQLHDLVATYCGNAFLQKELSRLARLFRSLRDAAWMDEQEREDGDRLAEEAREHLTIVRALRKRDRTAAVKAMAQHISISARYWSRGNQQSQTSDLQCKRRSR